MADDAVLDQLRSLYGRLCAILLIAGNDTGEFPAAVKPGIRLAIEEVEKRMKQIDPDGFLRRTADRHALERHRQDEVQ